MDNLLAGLLQKKNPQINSKPQGFEIVKTFREAHTHHGFLQLHAIGDRGSGKTTAIIQFAAELYGSYDEALKYFIVELDPLWPLIDYALKHNKRIPILMLDDIGRIIGKYTQFVKGGFSKLNAVFQLWEQLRTVCSGICCTSTKPNTIKPILDANTHGAKATKTDNNNAIVKIWTYSFEWWKNSEWWTPEYTEHVSLKLPKDVRKEIEHRRISSVENAIDDCKNAFAEKKETKQSEAMLIEDECLRRQEKGEKPAAIGVLLNCATRTVTDRIARAKARRLQGGGERTP